jgi:hypothetical protein
MLQPGSESAWLARLKAGLPFLLTAVVSVLVSLGLQTQFSAHQSQEPPFLPTPSFTFLAPTLVILPAPTLNTTEEALGRPTNPPDLYPTSVSTVPPLPLPEPTEPLPEPAEPLPEPAEGNSIGKLQAEQRRLWSAYYLVRAASQLADAEAALHSNDVTEVEQVLVMVGISLDRAYGQSAEQNKGPISEFRMLVGELHEDLRIRPEGMDQRLHWMRQSVLSLVDDN